MSKLPRRILLATDFSPSAAPAQNVAAGLARNLDAELHLLHVRVLLDDDALAEEHAAEIERLLEQTDSTVADTLGEELVGVPVEPHVVRGLNPSVTIVETASELGCDLIVVGTHGRRGVRHFLLGSVAEEVVRTAPIPVLTVRTAVDEPDRPPRSLLVPYDFSDHASAALTSAVALARRFGSEIRLLHVVEPLIYPGFYVVDMPTTESLQRIASRASDALDQVGRKHLGELEYSTEVEIGHPAETIVETADAGTADLIVMATRGLSGIRHALVGSVAERVVRLSHTPVLTIRSDADDA